MRGLITVVLLIITTAAVAEPSEQERIEKIRSEYFARFGVSGPNFDALYEVAFRKAMRFAMIEHDCQIAQPLFEADADKYAHCLEQREKAAKMLGHRMDEPDKRILRLRELFGFPVDASPK